MNTNIIVPPHIVPRLEESLEGWENLGSTWGLEPSVDPSTGHPFNTVVHRVHGSPDDLSAWACSSKAGMWSAHQALLWRATKP